MSTIVDVSSKLGEYMLKGWILTDNICAKCNKVPLMRSPSSSSTYLCANCDTDTSVSDASSTISANNGSNVGSSQARNQDQQSSTSGASSSYLSRSSTPPTEVSSVPSSPIFAPQVDPAEIMRRRQQSDTASAEIGKRMLRSWAMLADECPNSGCYGIPLVRPPKVGGEKDPCKECVICGTVYVDETDSYGNTRLKLLRPATANEPPIKMPAPVVRPLAATMGGSRTEGRGKDQAVVRDTQESGPYSNEGNVQAPPVVSMHAPSTSNSTLAALEASAQSLEATLHTLSDRLKFISAGPIPDPTLISQTADAISKVTQALSQVKQLQWAEIQAANA